MRSLDVRIDLDTGCNYRCIYCQNRSVSDGRSTHFPLDDFLRILPILQKSCWSVYLSCGGEPTLHPKFDEIMRKHVPQILSKTDVFLVTNGFRLNQNVCEAIVESGITRVNISVDTVDADLYGKLCGCAPSTLAVVLGNIETLLKVRGNKKYPKIFLTSVAMKSTMEKMPEVCAWVAQTGLDGHRIQLMIPYDTTGMQDENITAVAQANAVFAECKSILRKKRVYCDIPLTFKDKIESMIRGTSLVKNKVEYLIASLKKFYTTVQKPGCRLAGQLIRIDKAGNIEFCKYGSIQPGNMFDGLEIKLARRVKNAYKRIRKNKMAACSRECSYLVVP
jgi:MoaA/NifB/PqqE/SkfB family radical SAM enzyme